MIDKRGRHERASESKKKQERAKKSKRERQSKREKQKRASKKVAASKHGLPFVAFTRSESFAMTAFKHLPPWDDFQKGRDSDMLRMRNRFTQMLDRKHTETMRKHSQLKTAQDENEAFERWRDRRDRGPKRQKAEPETHRRPCPAYAAQGR